MNLSHTILALFSGIMLLLLVGGVYVTNRYDSETGYVSEPVTSEKSIYKPILTSEETLDLSGENLQVVPGTIFDKVEIKKLDLSHNNLSGALQAEVRFLVNLQTLDLSDNAFTGVPAEIGQLANLEVLDLSNNKLTGLPYELGNLQKLKILDLRGNAYTPADLDRIRASLPSSTNCIVD